jgi:uncharacterized phage protein (TIGR01671 family)
MRPIIFRGLRKDGAGWIYGDLLHWKRLNRCAVVPQEGDQWDSPLDFEVIPETVGQFTGLQDSKGMDIYEGDIVLLDPTDTQVIYSNAAFMFVTRTSHNDFISWRFYKEIAEVIGNIHENTKR